MTGPVIEQARPRPDRWPAAGIVTARADRLKTPRTPRVLATADGRTRIATVGNHRHRDHIASVTHFCRASAHSTTIGTRFKTP